MGFGTAVQQALIHYADFEGRASRSAYWWFILFLLLVKLISLWLLSSFLPFARASFYSELLSLIFFLPSLSVTARRLHDVGKSGWMLLLPFTIIGIIPFLYWMLKPSDEGRNAYGDAG